MAGGRAFDLTATAGISEFKVGVATSTIGLNGPYLGPTIRCRAGERVTLRVKNGLDEPTTLHWHGLQIPAREDGGPHQVLHSQQARYWGAAALQRVTIQA